MGVWHLSQSMELDLQGRRIAYEAMASSPCKALL